MSPGLDVDVRCLMGLEKFHVVRWVGGGLGIQHNAYFDGASMA